MKIIDLLDGARPCFSFEFFPPKDAEGQQQLFETVARLAQWSPTFVSVTYGAGGSTRKLTVELVRRIQQEVGLETMAHLTAVGATREELRSVVAELAAAGIENVLALRGDPPKGATEFPVVEGGFRYASELVSFLKSETKFCLAGACYPEIHPEAKDPGLDLQHLKEKVDSGLSFLITQLFFQNADYFRFVERARAVGITVPILPGIMPVTNLSQVKRFTAMCGASLPEELIARLEAAGDDAAAVREVGVNHAVAQCRELLAMGAPGIHFYTLNRSPSTVQVLQALRG